MTPEQIAALTQISQLVAQMGAWPIGSLFIIICIGPWLVLVIISRAMEKRFEAQLKMYETNVRLVEKYEMIADEQADTIRLSTSATVELTTYLKSRPPCHERIMERLLPR